MNEAIRQGRRNGLGVVALAAAVAFCLLAAGCGSDGSSTGADGGDATAQSGGTLRIADVGEPASLNPFAPESIDISSIRAIFQVVEPLFKTNADGEVEPWLVVDTKRSADGLTWTFELRDGVKFSNGKPMTAEDVVYSLDTVRKAENWAPMFQLVSSVSAPSPNTVVVKTTKPSASLEADLSLYAAGIVPKNFGGESAEQFGEHPIGTGPFKVVKWDRGQALTMERNAGYWKPEFPLLDKLVFNFVPDDNSRVAQVRSGQLDVAASPPWSQIAGLEQTPDLNVGIFALGYTDYMVVNVRTGLLSDPRAREAISLGIDRESIVDAALAGKGKPAGSWLNPSLKFHDSGIEPPQRDVAKAKQLLSEAIEETGGDASLKLVMVAGDTAYNTAGQVMQENLNEVGFDVSLQPLDEAAAITQLFSPKSELTLIYATSDIVDPSELIGNYIASEGVGAGVETEELEKIATAALSEEDEGKRRDLYYEAQQIIHEQNGLVSYDYRPFVFVTQDNVAGFNLNSTGIPWFAETGFSG